MIQIKDKSACCGCAACVQRCPKQCIFLKEDKEGFLYPIVDKKTCIDCGLCEKVCPIINQNDSREPLKVYAAKHTDDEIRMKSSSGGIFTLLAEQIIDEGGVVFGARFDEYWEVMHDYTETKEGLAVFRGSKYVQSRIGNTYQQAENFLKQGRKVMFTGTPCQIAGLKRFLRKEYENLLAVDFVCHGVPSPKVWRMYLDETLARQGFEKNTVLSHAMLRQKFIRSVEFRSKSTGWKKFSFALTLTKATADGEENTVLLSTIFTENPFMQAFLGDYILRPSCYKCVCKSGRSGADITIGDFWGIENVMPEIDDDKGISLVMTYTNIGLEYYHAVEHKFVEVSYKKALVGNSTIEESVNCDLKYRRLFWNLNDKINNISHVISKMRPSFARRCIDFVKRRLTKLILR